jgi:hypothetical protein
MPAGASTVNRVHPAQYEKMLPCVDHCDHEIPGCPRVLINCQRESDECIGDRGQNQSPCKRSHDTIRPLPPHSYSKGPSVILLPKECH